MRFGQVMVATVVLGCFLLSTGCGSGEKKMVEPDLSGKADVLSEVNFRGQLDFGGEATGEFVNDFQFEAWTFQAKTGSVVTIENSHQGTSSSLDSTLFLYGPANDQGKFEGNRIAKDDDSGWGPHAKLQAIALPREGSYAVVLGTASGDGRGKYRVTLACLIDSCEPGIPDVEGCPGDLEGWMEMCMEAAIHDDGEMRHVALENCLDNLRDRYVDSCEYESVPPAWCGIGFERFEAEVVPACEARMDAIFPPDDLDKCDPVLLPYLEDCVNDRRVEAGQGLEAAVEHCTDESVWTGLAEAACEYSSPTWCHHDFFSVWERMIGDCRSKLADIAPLPAAPSPTGVENLTETAVLNHLSYDDEGYHCDARDFEFGDYDTESNADGDVVVITAVSTAEGPVNYCAGYTLWECHTEFRPYRGAWSEVETDCEDIGHD